MTRGFCLTSLFAFAFAFGCTVAEKKQTIESVNIEKNGVPYLHAEATLEELTKYCEDYKLSEANVIEFFRVARKATQREFNQVRVHPGPNCSVEGGAVSNGTRVKWHIGSDRYGALWSKDEAISEYYYCHDCNTKVFEDDCDYNCEISGGRQ